MQSRSTNETDIREEIASPFLKLLGYERGTANDILREYRLSYDRVFLGRKKSNDPPLTGRADYILNVTGAGRWVLEIKSPASEILVDEIEQAITYARHPEVSASYVALTNGRRFQVYPHNRRAADGHLVDIAVESPEQLARDLAALLSPAAIRRDCTPKPVDLRHPLFEGFKSRAAVRSGYVTHSDFTWKCDFPLPDAQVYEIDDMCKKMVGYRSAITGGNIWRDEGSRIIAKINWALPHEAMAEFMAKANFDDNEFVSLSPQISTDSKLPTTFDFAVRVQVKQGDVIYDPLKWESNIAGIPLQISYRGQALGSASERTFKGTFQAEYDFTTEAMPTFHLSMYTIGDFEIGLDPA